MELVEERTVTSIASQSYEWLTRTFLENYCLDVSQTAYVTANVYAAKAFDGQTGRHPFFELEEVWRTDWDEESGTIPAEAVTEAAKPYVDVENNESGPEKVIVHYMQPHFPSIPDPITEQQTPVEFGYTGQQIKFAWNKLQDREVSEQRVRESFQNNLRYVLESVEELVEESGGKVVLSSDHGQSFGEWGVYGHPPSTAMKQVLEVPWVVVQEPSKRVHEKNRITRPRRREVSCTWVQVTTSSDRSPKVWGVPQDQTHFDTRSLAVRAVNQFLTTPPWMNRKVLEPVGQSST